MDITALWEGVIVLLHLFKHEVNARLVVSCTDQSKMIERVDSKV